VHPAYLPSPAGAGPESKETVLQRTMTTKILHVPKDVNRERATTVFFACGVVQPLMYFSSFGVQTNLG
jgi:hypothetical protein